LRLRPRKTSVDVLAIAPRRFALGFRAATEAYRLGAI
jgi:hypothetical protein